MGVIMEYIINTDILTEGMEKRSGKWSEIALQLNDVKKQLKTLSLTEDKLIKELQVLSEGKPSFDENGFLYKPYEVKGLVDYKRVPQLHNVDLEPFRKPSYIAWRFSVTK
jgi:hypothetical protein